MTADDDADDLEERRQAEVEFVSSAYAPDEAWCTGGSDQGNSFLQVHRRIPLTANDSSSSIPVVLTLTLPPEYPARAPLGISFQLEAGSGTGSGNNSAGLTKAAFNAMPQMVAACTTVAQELVGEEAVFAVLSHTDDWISEEWPQFCHATQSNDNDNNKTTSQNTAAIKNTDNILGRRLIYSHHIISKIKRAQLKELGSYYQLTGYVKIGWPGLILIEALESNCQSFYDDIKQWAWKYLVVRGEQQEKSGNGSSIEGLRKFETFQEVSEMSLVANHCRQVGLEALFLTSMKVYENNNENSNNDNDNDNEDEEPYGTLVWVNHMNNGKAYRKWLRKTSTDTGTLLLVKQCHPNHDFSKRPIILVAVVGNNEAVQDFMKRWRTSRVDVDAKGKPCLERQMTILHEGNITMTLDNSSNNNAELDWDMANAEDQVNVGQEQLLGLIEGLGNEEWTQATKSLLFSPSV